MRKEKVNGVKSLLAKLLATENLQVSHAKVHTAMFYPVERKLVLPIYKTNLSIDELDLFVGHEVGHALFTPAVDPSVYSKGRNGYHQFLNIVEDARIEREMQRRFPGLKKNFKKGYADLVKRNFFGDKDPNSYNFIDRINTWFKSGDVRIQFTDEEMVFVNEIDSTQSFDEVVVATDRLYDFCQSRNEKPSEELPEEENEEESQTQGDNEDGDEENASGTSDGESNETGQNEDEDSGDFDSNEDGEDSIEDDSKNDGGKGTTSDKESDGESKNSNNNQVSEPSKDEMTSETTTSSEEAMQKMVEDPTNTRIGEVRELTIPKDVSHSIVDMEGVKKIFHSYWKSESNVATEVASGTQHWDKFKSEQKSIVSYMVKEFEMKKSASEYKRTQTAKTGQLDIRNLHKYKFTEDLFKKASVVLDGKNHGLFMVVDWSGSMSHCISDVIAQIQVLGMFCNKVNIPFDVYAFSDNFGRYNFDDNNEELCEFKFKGKVGDLSGDADFRMLHLLSSKMNKRTFNDSQIYLSYLRNFFSYNPRDMWDTAKDCNKVPALLTLSGTPLAEAILTSIPLVKQFKKQYGVDILHTIFLTDGYGSQMRGYWDGNEITDYRHNDKIFVKGDKGTYDKDTLSGGDGFYFDLLRKETGVNVIGYYMTSNKQNSMWYALQQFTEGIDYDTFAKDWKVAKKNAFYHVDKGVKFYDELFFVFQEYVSLEDENWKPSDTELNSKAKLANSFIKSQTGKLKSRSFLTRFIDSIA